MKPVVRMPWDIVVFVIILVIGFGFAIQRVISPEQREARASTPSLAQRKPASLNLKQNFVPKVLDLGCLLPNLQKSRISTEEGMIRVKGKLCHMNKKDLRGFDGIHIKNKTNGYEGTVFFFGADNSFISDYLVLSSGKNVIEVEWQERKGAPRQICLAEVIER